MTSKVKDTLLTKLWTNKTDYYIKSREASRNLLKHKGFKIINNYLFKSKIILDVGCGEGTKLSQLGNPNSKKIGVDISREAINEAKKQYPNITFQKTDIEYLPFKDNYSDACYSAFVLEHLENPCRVLKEMVRVTKKNGLVIIICPNYGAPNRHSPCFKGLKIVKLIYGLIKQVIYPPADGPDSWNRVIPRANLNKYTSDSDTLIEPELLSLINYLEKQKCGILYWSSLWEEEISYANKIQKIFKLMAKRNIYPFIYWGPQILVIAKKVC